jgi:hypothetical protein
MRQCREGGARPDSMMNLLVVLRRKARVEFDAAVDWYEQQNAGVGSEFVDDCGLT